MQSKFAGTCKTCGERYPAGADIHWTREDGGHHQTCWDEKNAQGGDSAEQHALADRLGFKPVNPPL